MDCFCVLLVTVSGRQISGIKKQYKEFSAYLRFD